VWVYEIIYRMIVVGTTPECKLFGLEEVAARTLSEAKRLKFLMFERKRV
jgi:hypothetical protein